MLNMQRFVATLVVAILGAAVASSSASAYDITGGGYSGSGAAPHTMNFGGAYTIECDADFAGDTDNVTGDTAATDMTPTYSNCSFFGFPATVSASLIRLKITGSVWPPSLSIDLFILGIKFIEVPILGCEVTVSGPQSLLDGAGGNAISGANSGSGFVWSASVQNITYTTNGLCPFGGGSDGAYDTNGVVTFPGVSVV